MAVGHLKTDEKVEACAEILAAAAEILKEKLPRDETGTGGLSNSVVRIHPRP